MAILVILIVLIILSFLLIPDYLRQQKKKKEMRKEWEHARALRNEKIHTENHRKEILKAKDIEVDPIVKKLIYTKVHLKNILEKVDEDMLTRVDLDLFSQWLGAHIDVMDFCVFEETAKLLPKKENDFLIKDDVLELLDREFSAELCFDYADRKLGITREYVYWDGKATGGMDYEKGNGSFENIEKRYARILKQVPGAIPK